MTGGFMDYINDINELKRLVYPALTSKVNELNNLGYILITQEDIWNILAEERWKYQSNLALCDIVDDILNYNNEKLFRFFINKRVVKE